ncbi:MAG: hypothetical protein SFV15_06090 [Polyangiaceae bacterium]|nr:hypothetical protein [Polyangiaceae bacterium]
MNQSWTVLTSGLRILCFASPEEVALAAASNLVSGGDIVFPPSGPEFPVSELPLVEQQAQADNSVSLTPPLGSALLVAPNLNAATRLARDIWADDSSDGGAQIGTATRPMAMVSPDKFTPPRSRPGLSPKTVAVLDDLLRQRKGTSRKSRSEAPRRDTWRSQERSPGGSAPRLPLRGRPQHDRDTILDDSSASGIREALLTATEPPAPTHSVESTPLSRPIDQVLPPPPRLPVINYVQAESSEIPGPKARTDHAETGAAGRKPPLAPSSHTRLPEEPAGSSTLGEGSASNQSYLPFTLDRGTASRVLPASKRSRTWTLATGLLLLAFVGFKLVYQRETQSNVGGQAPSGPNNLALKLAKSRATGNIEAEVELLRQGIAAAPGDLGKLAEYSAALNQTADREWLRVWAMPSAASALIELQKGNLARLADESLWAATEYLEASGGSVAAKIQQLNALRNAGQIDRARQLALELETTAPSPERDYALGTLALVDPKMSAEQASRYLEAAARLQNTPERVRPALILAYLRNGELDRAERELKLLYLLSHPHAATKALSDLLERHRKTEATEKAAPQAVIRPPTPISTRDLLRAAERAVVDQDTQRARRLYHAVLARDASNCRALAGLGTLAQLAQSWKAAESYFLAANEANTRCLAAQLGLADLDWERGRVEQAKTRYREIEQSYTRDQYPDRVNTRAQSSDDSGRNHAGGSAAQGTNSID